MYRYAVLLILLTTNCIAAEPTSGAKTWLHRRYLDLLEVRRLHYQGKHEEAIALVQRCVARDKKYLSGQPALSESLAQFAELREALGHFEEARSLRKQALQGLRRLNQWPHAIVEQQLHLRRLDKIRSFDRGQLRSLEQLRTLRLKLNKLMQFGRYRQAIGVAKSATDLAAKLFGTKSVFAIDTMIHLAESQGRSDQLSAAHKNLTRCLALRQQVYGKHHPRVATTMRILAWTNILSGRAGDGAKMFQNALKICERVYPLGHYENLYIRQGLAEVAMHRGDMSSCRYHLNRSLQEIRHLFGRSPTNFEIDTVSRLGSVQLYVGDVDLAITHFERARAMAKSLGNYGPYNQALDSYFLARAYSLAGQHMRAVRFAKATVENYTKAIGARAIQTALSMVMQGDVLLRAGRHTEAMATHQKALKICRTIVAAKSVKLIMPLLSLALSSSANRQHQQAIQLAKEAHSISKQGYGERHVNLIRCHSTLADVLAAAAQPDAAEAHHRQAMKLTEWMAPDIVGFLSETESLRFAKRIAEYRDRLISHWQLRKKESALAAYRLLWNTRGIMTRALAERAGKPSGKQSKVIKELIEVRRRLARAYRYRKLDPRRLEGLTNDKERLERQLASTGSIPKSVPLSKLEQLLPARTCLVELHRIHFHDPSRGIKQIRYDAYVVCRETSGLKSQQLRVRWVQLGSAEKIDKLIDAWRKQFTFANARGIRVEADPTTAAHADRALSKAIWFKLEALVGNARHLIIIPDGRLSTVAWHALLDKRGRNLIEKYSISYAAYGQMVADTMMNPRHRKANGSVSPSLDSSKSSQLFVGVGGVDFDRDLPPNKSVTSIRRSLPAMRKWKPLKESEQEVDAAMSLWSGKKLKLSRQAATESALKRILPKSRFVHLATHGFVRTGSKSANHSRQFYLGGDTIITGRNPLLLTGLVLAGANAVESNWRKTGELNTDDGILSAEEINGLRLPGVELVVLSACDTGLGPLESGEGVIGLQRAFHVAGARSSVATLWPVHDGASRALWTRFYQLLFAKDRRLGKAAALRQAQLDLLHGRIKIPRLPKQWKGKRLPPHFWAAWALAGDWR